MGSFLAFLAFVVSFPVATLRIALQDLLSGKTAVDTRLGVAYCTLPDSSMLFFGGAPPYSPRFTNFLRLQNGVLYPDTMRYPGTASISNLLFVRGPYLYCGGGYDSSASQYTFTDFWRRNLHTQEWEQLRDLPFLYRSYQYISAGKELLVLADKVVSWDRHTVYTRQTLLRYRPEADAWDSLSACPVDTRYEIPVVFESDTTLYVLLLSGGANADKGDKRFFGVSKKDYQWTEKASFPVDGHILAAGYYEKGIGYVASGSMVRPTHDAVYRYDPVSNKWSFDHMGPSMANFVTWKGAGGWYAGFGGTDAQPLKKSTIFKLTGEGTSPPTK